MRDLIVAFLSQPSTTTYAQLRDAYIRSPEYRPEEPPDGRIWDLLEQDDLDQAEALAQAAKSRFLLSPATHVALGAVARKRGDDGSAQLEFHFANSLRSALLQTGEGTLESPFVVNRVADEFGILSWKEARPQSFAMRFHQGRLLDIITTPELGEVYFDISIPMGAYPS